MACLLQQTLFLHSCRQKGRRSWRSFLTPANGAIEAKGGWWRSWSLLRSSCSRLLCCARWLMTRGLRSWLLALSRCAPCCAPSPPPPARVNHAGCLVPACSAAHAAVRCGVCACACWQRTAEIPMHGALPVRVHSSCESCTGSLVAGKAMVVVILTDRIAPASQRPQRFHTAMAC